MRRRRGVPGAMLVAVACGLLSASSASATTVTLGQLFTPTVNCSAATFLQTGVGSGTSYTVPKAGVITSWSFEDAATTVPGLKLKVGRSAGGASFTILADATAGTQVANSVNTYPAHIPVKAGDLIGIYQGGGLCGTSTGNPLDDVARALGVDVPPGTTATFVVGPGAKLAVSVKVALDCVAPKLKGKTLSAAKDALADASCALGKITKKESSGKPGIVLSQKPNPGKQLSPGAKVAVAVSSS